jgi:hypothetical protein
MKIIGSDLLRFPSIAGNSDATALCAVLAEDAGGDYAVYVGIVPSSHIDLGKAQIENWIAGHGAKQTFRDAAYYFRGLDESKYRR